MEFLSIVVAIVSLFIALWQLRSGNIVGSASVFISIYQSISGSWEKLSHSMLEGFSKEHPKREKISLDDMSKYYIFCNERIVNKNDYDLIKFYVGELLNSLDVASQVYNQNVFVGGTREVVRKYIIESCERLMIFDEYKEIALMLIRDDKDSYNDLLSVAGGFFSKSSIDVY